MWQLLHNKFVAQYKELVSVGKISFLQLALFHQSCLKNVDIMSVSFCLACETVGFLSVSLQWELVSFLSCTKAGLACYLFIVYIFPF